MNWLTSKITLVVFAQGDPGQPAGGTVLTNPIKFKTVNGLIEAILGLIVDIGVPIVVLAIIYVGFLFVSARGSEDGLKKAKNAFLWTVVGAAIVLGAFVIFKMIEATVSSLK